MKSNMRYTKRKFSKASLLEIITSVLDDDYFGENRNNLKAPQQDVFLKFLTDNVRKMLMFLVILTNASDTSQGNTATSSSSRE